MLMLAGHSIFAQTNLAMQDCLQDCEATLQAPRIKFSLHSDSFSFDNVGQSYASKTHFDNLTSFTTLSHNALLKSVEHAEPWLKYGLLGAHLMANIRLQFGNAYVLHEYAHLELDHHLGFDNVFVGKTDEHENVVGEDAYINNVLRMSFGMVPWDFTSRKVGNTSDGVYTQADLYARSIAAGLNFNTYLAEESYHNMLHHQAAMTEAVAYLSNKLFPAIYFKADDEIGGDPSDYLKALLYLDVKIDKSEVQTLNLAAALLSNGFLSSVYQFPKYFKAVHNISLLNMQTSVFDQHVKLFWPEFSTYLNTLGVSVQAEVFAEIANVGLLGLAVEKNVLGENEGMDLTASYAFSYGKLQPEIALTFNTEGGYFADLGLNYHINDHLSLTSKVFSGGV